ncbi:hypothetical protein PVAND_017448 [Polypedilum vanderplanki]|uniref:Peptidase S1 domain-containing protein n=1 Tax=Polypedilum vanderplanki TaxID=319348 RepID=A0A9J6BI38_POLVA|nr:hypothetical protein PVAND_017448 [Polypedilum vanderplanki]
MAKFQYLVCTEDEQQNQGQNEAEESSLFLTNTNMEFSKKLHYLDNLGRNLLVIAVESQSYEEVKELLEIGLSPVSSFKGKSVVDIAYENGNFDIVQILLENNSRFPKSFNAAQTKHDGLIKFDKITREFHSKIIGLDDLTEVDIKKYKSIYPDCKYFYGLKGESFNRSAPFVALSRRNNELYNLFIKNQIYLQFEEDDWLMKNSNVESNEGVLLNNIISSNDDNLPSTLISKSFLGRNLNQSEAQKRHNCLIDSFKFLNNIPENKQILQFLSKAKKVEFVFDFTKFHCKGINSRTMPDGIKYIVIGAKQLLEPENEVKKLELYGIIMKEFSKYVQEQIYNNYGKPYRSTDQIRKKEYKEVMKECFGNTLDPEPSISDVLDSSYDKKADLFATVSQLYVIHFDNEKRIEDLKKNFKKLFGFHENFGDDIENTSKRNAYDFKDGVIVYGSKKESILKKHKIWVAVLGVLFLIIVGLSAVKLINSSQIEDPDIYSGIDYKNCGHQIKQNETGRSYIAGKGSQVSYPGQWPFHGALLFNLTGQETNNFSTIGDTSLSYFCGLTILNKWFLVTAAHCTFYYDPDEIVAALGRYDLSNNNEPYSIMVNIAKIFNHPDYNPSAELFRSNNDIAILKMKRCVEFNNFIQPICFPKEFNFMNDITGYVNGYGNNNDLRAHEIIPKYTALKLISKDDCILNRTIYSNIVSKRSFCGGQSEATPCKGDSGGGFYVQIGNTNHYMILGIVSQGLNAHKCNPNDMVVFVNILDYRDWIFEIMKNSDNDSEICHSSYNENTQKMK